MTHEQIVEFLDAKLKLKPIVEKENYYIFPTICHNINSDLASHKLYLYKNERDDSPIFTCYTECGESFNVYKLIQKYQALRGEEYSYREAYEFFHGKSFTFSNKPVVKEEPLRVEVKEFENPTAIKLPPYPEGILHAFTAPTHIHPWALEGIDLESLEKFEIGFSATYGGVTIPHRDWRGNLVGLRLRTYDPELIKNVKYMPMLINNTYYRHPTSLNLFGIFQNQKSIRRYKTAILVESEKSVLQAETMFEQDNLCLAVCGSSISNWQINMLIYHLQVEEVIIAFDKEYKNFSESFHYVQKIAKQVETLKNFANVSVLIDENDIFAMKESPFDRTAKDYYKLKKWAL